ncbi:hypothetical protein COE51_15430 [Bacillus pseudomycoides]|nr:hypothetical protein COE51_15430 [Bacillus pseudomycoides]
MLVATLKSKEYIQFIITAIWLVYIMLILFTPYLDFLSWGIKILILFTFLIVGFLSYVFKKN